MDPGKDSIQNFTQARWPEPTIGSGSAARRGAAPAAEVEDVGSEAVDVLGLVRAQPGQGGAARRP